MGIFFFLSLFFLLLHILEVRWGYQTLKKTEVIAWEGSFA